MAHTHENCTTHQYLYDMCNSGILTSACSAEYDTGCENEYCMQLGHCDCNCHSGKECGCGHVWPKMEKQTP